MTIEEISVKFTADTNALKKALSDITETLKGTEAQTMDIASALDEITQPIKDMAKDLRTLTEQSAAYNKQMSEVTKTVSGTGKAVGEINSRMQTVSKQSVAETSKMATGWREVKDQMLEVGKTRPTFNTRNIGTVPISGRTSRTTGESTQNTTQNLSQDLAQKALDEEQAKLQKLQNTLNGYRIKLDEINHKYDIQNQKLQNTLNGYKIKLDVVNQKYDIQNQKVQKTSNDIQAQQAKLEGLKRDYEAMASIMSELDINDSINAEMSRLKTTLDENKISANELFDAMERLKQSPYDIIDVGNSFMSMEDMTKKMNELDTSSEQAWGRLEKLETAMEGVSAKSRNFGSTQGLQRMNSVIMQQENRLRSLQNAYSTASSQSAGLSGQQEMLQAKIEQTGVTIQQSKDRTVQLGATIQANMKQTRESIQQSQEKIAQLGATLQAMEEEAKKANKVSFLGSFRTEVKNLGNAVSSLIHRFQNGVSHIRNFGTAAGNVGHKLLSLYENTTLIGRGLSSLKDKMSGLGSKFSQTSRMVKSMVLSMLFMQLMSGMGETLQSFAKQSTVVNHDLSLLASSFTYLKSSILSAFQPLLSYITPILTRIVNTVADAFNKLAEFFAYLTGQTTFEKAVYTQKDYSASLDQSAASAKELQNVLLGFDQITKLDDNSGSSGSGGSGNGLNTGNWETTKVDISSSLADSIKSGNWEAVGKALGDKINSALGSIDWNSVQEKCNSVAGSIADFLNGAVEGTDWTLVGSTLGNGINTILGAINTFQEKFDFKKWGESLATALNSTLSTTDWTLAGNTLGTAVQNVIDTGFGFVKTFDFKKAGESASKTVNSFFGAIDFKEGGKTFGEGVKGILNSISTFFDEVDWDSIGTDLVDAITSVDWIGIITGAIKAIISVAGAFYKLVLAIWDAIINQIKSTDWSAQAQKIWEGIKDVWSKLKDTALEVGMKIKQTAEDLWGLVVKVWANNKGKELEIAAKLSAKLDDKVEQVKTWAKEKLSEWKDKIAELSAKVVTTVDSVKTWWNNRASWWKSKKADFSIKVTTAVSKVKEWAQNRRKQWNAKKVGFSIQVTTAASKVKEWWNSRSNQWKSKVIKFTIKAATSVESIKNSFKSAINTVIGWINTYIIDNLNKVSISIPEIKVLGKTLYDGGTFGFDINHISTFATGGFPEDGLFMANHGELVGKFSNGKTAVTNNAQIVEGIEAGVYRAVTAANNNGGKSGGNTPVIKVYIGGKEVTDVVVKDINDRTIQTGKNPILV